MQLQKERLSEWQTILQQVHDSISAIELETAASLLKKTSTKMAEARRVRRNDYFLQSVNNETELETALAKAQALLWLDRLVYHYWRAIDRLVDSLQQKNTK